jgi:hypothetical protein
MSRRRRASRTDAMLSLSAYRWGRGFISQHASNAKKEFEGTWSLKLGKKLTSDAQLKALVQKPTSFKK